MFKTSSEEMQLKIRKKRIKISTIWKVDEQNARHSNAVLHYEERYVT